MFPVTGFSVSASRLRSEICSSATVKNVPAAAAAAAPAKKTKKRKRAAGAGNGPHLQEVTEENLAALWEKVIEHKAVKGKEKRKRLKTPTDDKGEGDEDGVQPKKHKKEPKSGSGNLATAAEASPTEEAGDDAPVGRGSKPVANGKKRNAKDNQVRPVRPGHVDRSRSTAEENKPDSTTVRPEPEPIPAAPKPQVKLTPLQASMREKLVSARFRHLNETLYTRPSADAFQLFQESPEMFSQYHEGFRRQVDVWPENPVTGYIEEVKMRAKVRGGPQPPPPRSNGDGRKPSSAPTPLPRDRRNGNLCTIADLGCGDAALASALRPLQKKLHVEVRSFDLHDGGSDDLVTRADIANLPLADGSVDVAVFCLALMGTNWVDFVEEAYRVLRWKGELWVAEIKSRFAGSKGGKRKVVPHSVGYRRNVGPDGSMGKAAGARKGRGNEGSPAEEADLAVEVDGAEDRRHETDVSAFVDVLRRRGFLLRGEAGDRPGLGDAETAVDLRNKMFVKMCFVKAAPATRGKCARPEQHGPGEDDGQKRRGFLKKARMFIDPEEEQEGPGPAEEARVLKPCVYKLR